MKPINFEQTGIYKKGVSLVDKETLDNIAYEAQRAGFKAFFDEIKYINIEPVSEGVIKTGVVILQYQQHFELDKE